MSWLIQLQKHIEAINTGTGEPIKGILAVLVNTYGFELKEKEQ